MRFQFIDNLVNFAANLGTARDKRASTEYLPIYEYAPEHLMHFYRASWIVKKVVTIPAFDTFRKWRDWKADKEQIEFIEAEEQRLGVQVKYLEALIKARLFGGAAIYIDVNDFDLTLPLDPERVKKQGIRTLSVMTRSALTAGPIVLDPRSELYTRPEYYQFSQIVNSPKVHPSRFVVFQGDRVPEDMLGSRVTEGWGDSIITAMLNSIKDADATAANVASLVFEAKVDVLAVPDLMANLSSPAYETLLTRRFGLAAQMKGINGMLVRDKDEEYDQKSATFQTLPDVIMVFFQIVAGAADIPMTRFMGMSPGGMNSTGDSDMRNYYDKIASIQHVEVSPATRLLDDALIRSALGARPPEVHYAWASLWQMTDKERAEVGKLSMETIKGLTDTGLFPQEALANAASTLFVEHGILPSLIEQIEDAGGLPDYEALMEEERAAQAAVTAKTPVTDAAPKTLYVRRDVVNHAAIAAHYEAQGFTVKDPAKLHVTVMSSTSPIDWFAVSEAWQGKLTLEGGARDHATFGPMGLENSFVLMIKSSELEWRHEAFKAAGARSNYDEYQPHITLLYSDKTLNSELLKLKPYLGEIVLGPEIFEEVKG